MKKRLFALLCILALAFAGCSAPQADEPDIPDEPAVEEPSEPETVSVLAYVPDEQAEYLRPADVEIPVVEGEEQPATLIRALIAAGALPEGVTVLNFADARGELALDLSGEYLTALQASGSAGETMLIYAVVDTFLTAYDGAESLYLTVDGQQLETEHGLYTAPFTETQYIAEE